MPCSSNTFCLEFTRCNESVPGYFRKKSSGGTSIVDLVCYITNTLVTHDTKMHEWHDNEPIYQQLRTTVLHRILAGTLAEGEAVPSVRQVATTERINPLTVSRAYQLLVDEGLLEKRRGLGLFVTTGASNKARTSRLLVTPPLPLPTTWSITFWASNHPGVRMFELARTRSSRNFARTSRPLQRIR